MGALARRFAGAEDGFVLVFVAILIPALLGLAGLAVDGWRLMNLDARLAAAVDAAALAAANRLDRSAGAIPNARDAARALARDAALGESTGVRLTFRFAAQLDDLRRGPSSTLGDAAGPIAAYVEVTSAEVSFTGGLLGLVGAGRESLRRRAVAVSRYYACDVTPAVLCQPDPEAFAAAARPGRQYLLRMDGNRVAGSIALLDRPGAEGPRQALRDLASNAPAFCYADGVTLRTNVAARDFDAAIGVRFDRYAGRDGPIDPDLAAYPPAPNVIQGRHLETCASDPAGGSVDPPYHLPRDAAYAGLRLSALWDGGAGDWKTAPAIGGTGRNVASALEEYLLWNHDDKPPDVLERLRSAPTRYDLYLRELGLTRATEASPVDTRAAGAAATMPTGGPRGGALRFATESPVPVCYSGRLPPVEPRRRILYLTVANCGDFPAAATAGNLSRYVAKFFLTEPSALGALPAEFVDLLRPTADDGKLRHVVQLVDTQ